MAYTSCMIFDGIPVEGPKVPVTDRRLLHKLGMLQSFGAIPVTMPDLDQLPEGRFGIQPSQAEENGKKKYRQALVYWSVKELSQAQKAYVHGVIFVCELSVCDPRTKCQLCEAVRSLLRSGNGDKA